MRVSFHVGTYELLNCHTAPLSSDIFPKTDCFSAHVSAASFFSGWSGNPNNQRVIANGPEASKVQVHSTRTFYVQKIAPNLLSAAVAV